MSLAITKSHFVLDWGKVLPLGALKAYNNDHIGRGLCKFLAFGRYCNL